MKVSRKCFCGAESFIELTKEEYQKYQDWRNGDCYIQDIPLNAVEREFLKTGMCRKCQKMIFNNDKSKRLKKGLDLC